jgi:hypothetical protein
MCLAIRLNNYNTLFGYFFAFSHFLIIDPDSYREMNY